MPYAYNRSSGIIYDTEDGQHIAESCEQATEEQMILLTAAPKLLAALQAVIEGPSKLNARLRFIVKQAIAKATA